MSIFQLSDYQDDEKTRQKRACESYELALRLLPNDVAIKPESQCDCYVLAMRKDSYGKVSEERRRFFVGFHCLPTLFPLLEGGLKKC